MDLWQGPLNTEWAFQLPLFLPLNGEALRTRACAELGWQVFQFGGVYG